VSAAGLVPADLPLTRRSAAAGKSVGLRLRAPGTPAISWAGSLSHATHLAAIFFRCRV